ncbi:MAG: hypothetical protein E7596_00550 [Ruminococcaceae bacterium]|nr:hypothetical protein [Oscillospiraceae bacterium]
MKKFFILIPLILLFLVFMSCNDSSNIGSSAGSNSSTNSNLNESGTNTEKSSDLLVPNDDKDLDNQDILDTLVPNDKDFPFDNIVVERTGYDIIAAGKYYGNDFDNVNYYGSYYRAIDNYEDFSELTQWGHIVDKSTFEDCFVLVLHTYKNQYIYYSNLDGKGEYMNFGFDASSNNLKIRERWIWGGGPDGIIDSNGNEIELPTVELHRIEIPAEIRETIYLLIPKDELPSNLPINGEIDLKVDIVELE